MVNICFSVYELIFLHVSFFDIPQTTATSQDCQLKTYNNTNIQLKKYYRKMKEMADGCLTFSLKCRCIDDYYLNLIKPGAALHFAQNRTKKLSPHILPHPLNITSPTSPTIPFRIPGRVAQNSSLRY